MRALYFDGKTVSVDAHYPAPVAHRDEAVVRLVKAIVTRGEVELWRGLNGFRGVVGHQFLGVVESVNGAANSLVGKRVVGSPIGVCGQCDMCLAGLGRHCRNRTIMGMSGRGGCLAERFSVPIKSLEPVPDKLADDRAVFAVSVAAAIQAAEQLTIVGKPYITVLGDGVLGLLMAQVMSKLNASVRLIGSDGAKLAVCEKLGIKHRHVDEVGRRADQDVVVDCTGSPEGLSIALQLVRPRGKVLLKSLCSRTLNKAFIDLTPVVLNEIEVIGSFGGPIRQGISFLARCEVDVDNLISKRMRLTDGLALMKEVDKPGALAVLIEP